MRRCRWPVQRHHRSSPAFLRPALRPSWPSVYQRVLTSSCSCPWPRRWPHRLLPWAVSPSFPFASSAPGLHSWPGLDYVDCQRCISYVIADHDLHSLCEPLGSGGWWHILGSHEHLNLILISLDVIRDHRTDRHTLMTLPSTLSPSSLVASWAAVGLPKSTVADPRLRPLGP